MNAQPAEVPWGGGRGKVARTGLRGGTHGGRREEVVLQRGLRGGDSREGPLGGQPAENI